MRVLYVTNGTGISGGANKSLMALIEYLMDQGVEVGVVCPDEKGLYKLLKNRKIFVVNAKYCGISVPMPKDSKSAIKFLPRLLKKYISNHKSLKGLVAECIKFNPDIIHENCSVTNIGRLLSKRLNKPYLLQIREYNAGRYVLGLKKTLRDKDIYSVCITRDLERISNRPIPSLNKVIYDGVIDEDKIDLNLQKLPYFFYAGRIEPNKGISDLIDAYILYTKQVKDPIPLVIAGGYTIPNYGELMRRKVYDAGIEDKVKWLGDIPDITELAFNTVATIIPSHYEGLGRVMPECMAKGSLCIARNTTGTKEQMDNGLSITGGEIAMRFENISDLVKLLIEVSNEYKNNTFLDRSSKYIEMIQRSQLSIRQYLTYTASGKEFLKFYNQILDETTL